MATNGMTSRIMQFINPDEHDRIGRQVKPKKAKNTLKTFNSLLNVDLIIF